MTHDQVRELVRRTNPVPNPDVLETVDVPVPTFERSRDMQVDDRSHIDQRPDQRGRGPLIGIAMTAVVLLAGVIYFVTRDDDVVAPPPTTPSTLDWSGATEIRTFSPDWLAADDSFVYARLDPGRVIRIDPATAEIVGETEVGGRLCQGLGVGFGSVWTCRGNEVVRIDPSRDEVIATIPIEKTSDQGNLATGFGRVWVLTGIGDTLVGIDPETNEPGEPISLPVRGTDLDVDQDHIWIVSTTGNALLRVDPTTNSVDGQVDDLAQAANVDATDVIWLTTANGPVRIDSDTLEVDLEVDLYYGRNTDVAASGADLFFRNQVPFLTHIDARDGSVIEEFEKPDVGSAGDVLIAFGAVWTSAYNDNALWRIPLG